MTRIPLSPPRTPFARLATWYSRRTYGRELEPLTAMLHDRRVALTTMRHEMSLARWNRVDPGLKMLAELAAASTVNCAWCVDFGFWLAQHEGMEPAKVRDVARWHDSDAYSDLERRVIEYAEAASRTPVEVTDAMVAGLREHLDDAQLVELTMMVAVENSRSRFNLALGLAGQGFSDSCAVPAPVAESA